MDHSSSLGFENFTSIDFGNINITGTGGTGWPSGGSGGGDQFSLVGGLYAVPAGMDIEGSVIATAYYLRESANVDKRLFYATGADDEFDAHLHFDSTNFPSVHAGNYESATAQINSLETYTIHGTEKLTFSGFSEIDFSDITISHFNGPSGSGGFPLTGSPPNQVYLADHDLRVDGQVQMNHIRCMAHPTDPSPEDGPL